MPTTSPDELFDILTADGRPTGRVKPRWAVHRDGDWHAAFHLWVAFRDERGQPAVLFQRRSHEKDTWPGRVDVAVGGHLAAGETVAEAVREIEEELGLRLSADDLVPVGSRRVVSHQPDWFDREHQAIHVVAYPDGLPALRPDPIEISALLRVRVQALECLFGANSGPVEAEQARVGPSGDLAGWQPSRLEASDFVPAPDRYWHHGALVATQVLRGDRQARLALESA